MKIETFKNKLKNTPAAITFSETMSVIDSYYQFTPTAFKNGDLVNVKNQNSGSCKLFAFAKAENLSKKEALACFGEFYYNEVLNDPDGSGHQNIRNFMNTGFDGLFFDAFPLTKK